VPILVFGWGTIVTNLQDGSTVIGVEPFYKALKKIARLKFWAAGCAAVSAATQAGALFLSR
jgi:hypothetical protein